LLKNSLFLILFLSLEKNSSIGNGAHTNILVLIEKIQL